MILPAGHNQNKKRFMSDSPYLLEIKHKNCFITFVNLALFHLVAEYLHDFLDQFLWRFKLASGLLTRINLIVALIYTYIYLMDKLERNTIFSPLNKKITRKTEKEN